MREKILVVDDDLAIRWAMKQSLLAWGYVPVEAANAAAARTAFARERPAGALLDLGLPDGKGLEVLSLFKRTDPDIVVIVLTGYSDTDNALAAGRRDAFAFLPKPVDRDRLRRALREGLAERRVRREAATGRDQARASVDDIIGESPAAQAIREFSRRASISDDDLLIQGETGTGKELLAKAIHYSSARARHPFIAINCGALNPNLIESELFGHERGAFTGSIRQVEGRFERANKGTLLLDEVGDLPLDAQVKLLRVLQERRVERVGGTREIPVNVRVFAATHSNLETAVRQGLFRRDLFYRLCVLRFELPPLRERVEDVRLLAEHFVRLQAPMRGATAQGFTAEAMEALMSHSWPGNVRELSNVINRALGRELGDLISLGSVEFDNIPSEEQPVPTPRGFSPDIVPLTSGSLRKLDPATQRRLVQIALQRCRGRRAEAARLLGLSRHQLYRVMSKLGGKVSVMWGE